ncbi:hypothetical protein [Parabacteroides sp. AM08-6]|uniref:hypothetical protein n=1 Tax=Parabacteroides sp. AM08-6 TaxID=2292053 RepID=UPI0011C3EB80|nr:hypothetical protein [Parabacteroides sp. AM08-6]
MMVFTLSTSAFHTVRGRYRIIHSILLSFNERETKKIRTWNAKNTFDAFALNERKTKERQ